MLKAPQTLRVSSDKRTLVVVWAPDNEQTLRAETLRVHSPSAEVKGHFSQGGTVPVGKEHVQMVGLEPVGSYAIKIVFSDGHSTGLYTWDYLRNLAAYA